MTTTRNTAPWHRWVFGAVVMLGILVSAQCEDKAGDASDAGKAGDSSPVNSFLEIAHNPSVSAAQKKTIAAVIRSVNAKNADEAYRKVMAGDNLVLYGGDPEFLTDIRPLVSFTNLKTLILYNNRISNITPLSALTKLETLRLELNRVSDISPLRNLANLQSLQIDDNQISDLRPLAGHVTLRTLWIMRNKVTDVTPLTGLAGLRDLYLSGNPIKDLTPLTHMSVSDLRLDGCGLADISALRDLNQNIEALINLDLSKNKIRNVEALAHLGRVANLNLADNRITDIGAFAHSKFSVLDLHHNQITDISAIASLSPQSVDVRNNPIKDYKPLLAVLRATPNAEIRADRGFDKALSVSVPVQPELAKSPVIGRWRCNSFDSGEFGVIAIVLRLEANGLGHMTICPPDIKDEIDSPVAAQHGQFNINENIVTLSLGGKNGEKQELQLDGKYLLLKTENRAIKFKKVD